jgi:hypothetical protein
MIRTVLRCAPAIVLQLLTTPLQAQDSLSRSAPVGAGTMVRIWVGRKVYTGKMVSRDADSIRVEVSNDVWGPERRVMVLALPLGEVTQLEIRTRKASHTGEGAALGMFGGALIGAGIGDLGNMFCGWDNSCDSGRQTRGALIGGAIGLLVGAIVGSGANSERWAPADSHAAGVLLVPERTGRLDLGLSLRF